MSRPSTAIMMMVTMFAVSSVFAGEPARAIVSVTKLVEQLTDTRETCKANEQAGDIERIAIGSPSMFHGIDSRSSWWPDARAAYLRYAVSTCVPQDIGSYVDLAASLYEDALSEEEMRAVLRFYKTDAGKKFSAISARLSAALNQKMYEESREVVKQGGIRFDSEMEEIKKRSNSSPDTPKNAKNGSRDTFQMK